jgi:putative ABC transport system ATP-binding protein
MMAKAEPQTHTDGNDEVGTVTDAADAPAADVADSPADELEAHPLLLVRDMTKVHQSGRLWVEALREVSLEVRRGEYVSIMGPSGSGKSTLLTVLGCLDRPTAGVYELAGSNVSELSDDELADIRNREIGFIFQAYNLLPRSTALQNVELPLVYAGVPRRERARRARAMLERVGLADRMQHAPAELSGGQQQRVAIARALVTTPSLLLADEPTGNLDTASGADVMNLLDDLHTGGVTIVLITHEAEVADRAQRQCLIRDGRISETRVDVTHVDQRRRGRTRDHGERD